jgi:inosine triphosphate pyrophosphatase
MSLENIHKLLDGFDDKSATITCTFAYSQGPNHEPVLFQEKTHVIQIMIFTYLSN